ncbi:hypothetical protein [Neorhizobium alkalisoli]|uniref:Uncharacterized protein (TIGR02588 family) n=1 Tax=Neorhizobium alkalisoli TaxID=528178 RepID=A0A561QBN6_9HYPH|nr:hypothetical protein [Neorhizobium alkalisoli]TWF47784.1 uncharacterized protein (TIGR02588 family) [Neorhizobium alkalisoli]
MTKVSNHRNIETSDPHWIEWIIGAISAVIVLAVIVWIGKDGIADHDASPDLEGIVLQTEERSDGFQVIFEIRNIARATASQVKVRGEIKDEALVLESVETVLDYVPGHSKAAGGLIFQQNPAGKQLTVRATAFDEP